MVFIGRVEAPNVNPHHPNANIPNQMPTSPAPAPALPLLSGQEQGVDWDNILATTLSSLAVGVATGTTPKLSRSRQRSLAASYGRLKSEESDIIRRAQVIVRRAQVMDTLIAWGGDSTPGSNV